MTDPAFPLITVEELARRLEEVTILDVRYRMGSGTGHQEFLAGHVPGAVYVDLPRALAGPPGEGGRHPLPDPDVFADAMCRAGVRRERPVVVYDDWSGHAAARAWWLLRHHGHDRVRLLDGGWSAWQRAGHPTTGGTTAVPAGDFTAAPGAMAVAEAADLTGMDAVLDARTPERFRGEHEPVDPVAGHIPGAVNAPSADNLGPDGRFLPPAELGRRYADLGARPGSRVAAYCGSGVTAAHDVLALELAGVRAALYPGSWSGWISDPDRPVARGDS